MRMDDKPLKQITVCSADGEVLAVVFADGKIVEKEGISVTVEFT